ncbi:hypothetical protein VKT23_010786 [Stygiomarasmius scandens]|uniref:Mid2 domain-containing protein n=1 Tax=Marasmiellus scandens TaxID=2682957 RepID=A0ABR1JB49_9AGAR
MSSAGNEVDVEVITHETSAQVGTATVLAMDYPGRMAKDTFAVRDSMFSEAEASPLGVRVGDGGPDTITSTSTPVTTVSIPIIITSELSGQLTTFTTISESTSFSRFTTTRPPLLSSSSVSSKTQPNIAGIIGFVIGGIIILMTLILVGIKFYHRRRIRKNRRFQIAVESALNRSYPPIQPYDLKHESVHFADGTRHQILPNNRLSWRVNPPPQSSQDTIDSRDPAPEQMSRPQSAISVHSLHNSVHSAVTTSTMTARQVQLQEEANDLRDQVRRLQQTVDSSNDGVRGMQVAMERMMAHIQTLESQLNSDWARGLTDDPPPVYAEA